MFSAQKAFSRLRTVAQSGAPQKKQTQSVRKHGLHQQSKIHISCKSRKKSTKNRQLSRTCCRIFFHFFLHPLRSICLGYIPRDVYRLSGSVCGIFPLPDDIYRPPALTYQKCSSSILLSISSLNSECKGKDL